MISVLGRTLVLLALGACTVGSVAGLLGGQRKSAEAWRLSRWMAYAFGGAMVLATLLMEAALVTHDFSVSYVAEVGSRATPLHITLVSLWSSLNGSILFWGFILGSSTLAFTWQTREKDPQASSYALGALLAVGVFFSFLVAGVANPFAPTPLPVPTDGPGPNALLQNHLLMIIHPPALYLGYVNMAVPFAMSAAALMAGKLTAAWMRYLRRWMLFAWMFLTMGILLGGWWSYEVLGWGGYWAWDPVENASFMPWLTATAFLHSAMIMERKGQFKGWTLTLSMSSFLLTMLGTFMTRSGVFNSVHSFTQSSIGPVFLGFIATVLIVSLLLLATRLDSLSVPDGPAVEGAVSRESAFLANNLLFVAFTFFVLMGTLFPLVTEAMSAERISVGEPWFNKKTLPLCVSILFLMGVGPALPWGETSGAKAWERLKRPTILMAVVGGASLALFGVEHPYAVMTFAFAAFALDVTLHELLWPAFARAQKKGEPFLSAFARYSIRSRQRVGGYVVHLGVILAAVAIAGSSGFQTKDNLPLRLNEAADFGGYTLTFVGMETVEEPHRTAQVARVEVRQGERMVGTLGPRLNQYKTMREPIGTPAVMSGLRQDLYLSLVRVGGDTISVQAIVEPLVFWLWVGGIVMFLGAAWSLTPWVWVQAGSRKVTPIRGDEVPAK
ncbi:MAG: heme lyase CcmF/NrfE family subunit [Alphaproteobacteria bacterium]|nr:heme lyase CcmF/NrfE family subunit [Alphaproteobacteria bacterium]